MKMPQSLRLYLLLFFLPLTPVFCSLVIPLLVLSQWPCFRRHSISFERMGHRKKEGTLKTQRGRANLPSLPLGRAQDQSVVTTTFPCLSMGSEWLLKNDLKHTAHISQTKQISLAVSDSQRSSSAVRSVTVIDIIHGVLRETLLISL